MASEYVHKEEKKLTTGLIVGVGILTALLLAAAPSSFALPTADSLGVDNTSGYKDTYAVLPVKITNTQNGPIISLIFDIAYDKDTINLVEVQAGTLTSSWDSPVFNNFAWGTRVLLVYDGNTSHGIQNGTTGSVALLTISLIGTPASTSQMNLSNIQLSDTGYVVGTAPARNGTLAISPESTPTTSPTPAPPPAPAGRGGGGGGGSLPHSGLSTPTLSASLTPSTPSTAPSAPTPSPGAPVPAQGLSSTPIPTIKPLFLVIPVLPKLWSSEYQIHPSLW
ncbi:MAG: hypothetical protein EFT35_00120 [Methanophagales archaeon ANME-1-THS]|nr:MAG: hypothetical protein EFT35_00120 [Methanophagales archaeon ANME-1-THS]